MDYPWIGNLRENTEEVIPDEFLLIVVFSPKAVLKPALRGFNANPDQVVEIAVGNPFDVQKDERAFGFEIANTDYVNLIFRIASARRE